MSETEPEVVLEPGDPGYVAPEDQDTSNMQGAEVPNNEKLTPPVEGATGDPLVDVPAGEDLQHVRQPGETDAEFMARTRNVVVNSQSPTDIVPNTPQTTMGPRFDVEGTEGRLQTSVPPEDLEDEDQPEVPEAPPAETEPAPTEEKEPAA